MIGLNFEGVQTDIHREVIEKSKKGHRKAQFELYGLYAKAMYNICYRMMNNKEEAEDMLQESFTEVFRKLDTFRYESSFGSWIKRITVNRCINELKRKKIGLEFTDDLSFYSELPGNSENGIPEGLEPATVIRAMDQLTDGSRVIFSLYLLEGYDHREIASILNISESNSKTQYMRAKRKMREILSKKEVYSG